MMHLKPATSTRIQPHIEQDMGFSMLSWSGGTSFPVSNYADWSIPVKNKIWLFFKSLFYLQIVELGEPYASIKKLYKNDHNYLFK